MIHVTSNSFFGFHDDVFPAFSKNSVTQHRFPQPGFLIIPDYFFSTLEELKHISTVKMKSDETHIFHYEVDISEKNRDQETKFLDANLFDGTNLFSFGVVLNGSIWMNSDFIEKGFILKTNATSLKTIVIEFHTIYSMGSSFVEIIEAQLIESVRFLFNYIFDYRFYFFN